MFGDQATFHQKGGTPMSYVGIDYHKKYSPVADIFGKRGTDYMRRLNVPGVDGEILKENLQLLEAFNTLIKEAEREIDQ